MTPAEELDELRRRIRAADDQYYNDGESDLTDAQYDELFVKLRKLEEAHPALVTEDSPTQSVGAPLQRGGAFETQAHLVQMGSLESLMQPEDVDAFVRYWIPMAVRACSACCCASFNRCSRQSSGIGSPSSCADASTHAS